MLNFLGDRITFFFSNEFPHFEPKHGLLRDHAHGRESLGNATK